MWRDLQRFTTYGAAVVAWVIHPCLLLACLLAYGGYRLLQPGTTPKR